MRLLFVVHQFMPEFTADAEAVTLKLAKSAQAAGHYVEVLTASIRDASLWPEEHGGFRIAMVEGLRVTAIPMHHTMETSPPGFLRDESIARAARRFLDLRPGFDAAHVVHSMRMLDVVEILVQRRVPYVLTVTDFFLPCYRVTMIRTSGELCRGPQGGRQCLNSCRLEGFTESMVYGRLARTRRILGQAVSVNTCSDYVSGVLTQEYPELQIRVIPHGIDLRAYDPLTRRALGAARVFGYVGTVSEAKGVHVLAEAFRAGAPAGAQLVIAGPCFDEAFKARVSSIIDGDDRIAMHGPVEPTDRTTMLAGLDVLCLPSLWPETFSLAIHEGFAAGTPCLVSDFGAPADTVRRHGCGEVVDGSDVAGWSRAIRRAANSPALMKAWRGRIPLPFRIEEEAFFYDQLYRQAVVSGALRSL